MVDFPETQGGATAVLHTAFLAPLAAAFPRTWESIVIDVHDVIFRAHLDEARSAPPGLRQIRRAYASSVRIRESRALKHASALAVAGWEDTRVLSDLGLGRSRWAPVGLEAQLSQPPPSNVLHVGLIGNFHHTVTAAAAADLLGSPLGRDRDVKIVLAGVGSDRFAGASRVIAVGQVNDITDFYDQVHATVVPVTNASGMKCKLAESILAGKAVITTPSGAAGYPPELRQGFEVVGGADAITTDVVERAIASAASHRMRDRFNQLVGRGAAADTYAQVLDCADSVRREA